MFKNNRAFAAIILSSVGFGLSANARPIQIETIQVANTVPSNQVARLQADITYLKTLDFSGADADLKTLMGLTDVNSTSLLQWMETRVHYLIDENLDLNTSLSVAKSDYNFQNPSLLPIIEPSTATPADNGTAGSVYTIMLNIGGGLYIAGKQNAELLQLNIPGIGNRPVTSPRTGIVKVGAGLFAKLFSDASLTPDSKPYIAMRMGVLFHEAHHSDGNGLSTGFVHAVCPSGSYHGYSACDRNLNGPYQIEAKFVNSLITACTDCSDGDKKAMQVLAADSASRQIAFTADPNAVANDNALISILEQEISACKMFAQMNIATPTLNCNLTDLQNQIDATQAKIGTPQGTPSTIWDATPEGV